MIAAGASLLGIVVHVCCTRVFAFFIHFLVKYDNEVFSRY